MITVGCSQLLTFKDLDMESKPFQKFRDKLEMIYQHAQVVDAAFKIFERDLNKVTDQQEYITTVLGLSELSHPKLRQPIKEKNRLLAYSKSRSYEFAILEVFSGFTSYMKDITSEMFDSEPMKIVGKVSADSSSLTYNEIIKLGSMDNIAERMVEDIFRKFENERSTTKLIDKVLSHTKILTDNNLKESAMMYLEMRHLFIHAKGKADDKFISKYSGFKLKADGKLPTNFKTVTTAIKSVKNFAKDIDDKLLAKEILTKI